MAYPGKLTESNLKSQREGRTICLVESRRGYDSEKDVLRSAKALLPRLMCFQVEIPAAAQLNQASPLHMMPLCLGWHSAAIAYNGRQGTSALGHMETRYRNKTKRQIHCH